MTTAGLENFHLTVNATQTPDPWQAPTPKFTTDRKKHLVARWLRDENSQLYCQWILED